MSKYKMQVKCTLIQRTEQNDAVVLGSQQGKIEVPLPAGKADDYFTLGALYNIEFEETSVVIEPPKPLVKLT